MNKIIERGYVLLKIGVILLFIGLIFSGCVSADNNQPEEEAVDVVSSENDETERLRGRDFVQLGELDTVTGILKTEFGEWFLSSNDVTYEIHMGDHDHRKEIGINLEEGKKVTAAGFFYQQEDMENVDIAVTALTIDGEEYRFREDDGTPLWRGQGLESGQGPGGGSVGDREGEGHGQGSGHHRHQQN